MHLEWNNFLVASAAFPNLWGKAGSPGYVQDSTNYDPDPGSLLGISWIFLREITSLEKAAELEELLFHWVQSSEDSSRILRPINKGLGMEAEKPLAYSYFCFPQWWKGK